MHFIFLFIALNPVFSEIPESRLEAPNLKSEAFSGDKKRISYEDIDEGRARFRPQIARWEFVGDSHFIREGRRGETLNPITLEAESLEVSPENGNKPDTPQPKQGFKDALQVALENGEPLKGRPYLIRDSLKSNIQVEVYDNIVAARHEDDPVIVTRIPSRPELLRLAPGGKFLSGVVDNNLVVIDLFKGRWSTVTHDGSEYIFNGKLDWVYQEEVYGRGNFNAQWWSPDGKRLAYLKLFEEGVPEFKIVRHLPFSQEVESLHYPKAGQTNPRVELWTYDPEKARSQQMDIAVYGDERLIVRVDWEPDSSRVLPQIQDRIQSRLTLLECQPDSGKSQVLIEEQSNSWVNVLGAPIWLRDGSFLWKSERTGFCHIYHYRGDGTLIRQISRGEWAVKSIPRIDEDRGELWLTGSLARAIESHLFRIDMGGELLLQVTSGTGSHRTTISSDGEYVLDQFSSVQNPGEVRLLDRDGLQIHQLAEARVAALGEFEDVDAALHEVSARDGYSLDVLILKPTNMNLSEPLPVWIDTYSGPNSPSVRQGYPSSSWQRFLVHQGMVVMQVNVRSSSGRGHVDTATCYRQLGVQELSDLEDAVNWICQNDWADSSRVGISGWSYGGFMAAYALTHSSAFKLGLAGGGVYDWRDYDTIYTERYMDTPELNPEGYQSTSVVKAAASLTGHLVMFHGGMDDNVHLQNMMQLAHELQLNRKSFEMMVYPESRHGGGGRSSIHMRDMRWRAIQEHLLQADGES